VAIGATMNLQGFLRLLRSRWITVAVTLVVAILGASVVTMLTTPLYQSSTRLFVSTTAGSTISDIYQGNRFSQERVASYSELLTGATLAQRTIDKLSLDMDADTLRGKVTATAKLDTVLITVNVVDESPVRARDIANTLSDEFVAMVRELETPENGASPDSRVVVEQRASVSATPVVPKTKRNLAIGVLLGLVSGIAIAVLRDLLDNTVKDGGTVQDITGTSIVGSVPLDKERRKEPAITFDGDNSEIAEAFRKLRTNLQFIEVDNPPRVIVVTSSMPSEGKTTTAINISLALAEADHKVVLVDGDMRRPMLDKYLNLVGAVGLSTVLSGGASLEDALQTTRFSGLTALTSGAVPPNPSELLGSMAAQRVLGELRQQFDYVIVDSTPLLAVTDAAVLAAGADGALVVARYGQTRRDHLSHAAKTLNGVSAHLLGAVLTMVPSKKRSAYGYAYGYYGAPSEARATTESLAGESKTERDGDARRGQP